ncbi:MAG: DUF3369 domain-containing protein [Proteobacteria bacterium]|nr:DUF3369 domain-containing protein [Pseudomonadota bacterium]
MAMEDQEDVFAFLDEVNEQMDVPAVMPWRILVVDDDGEVHQATRFALESLVVLDKPITLIHAYSAAEAESLLRQMPDIAAVLLDVVMESDDSGLCLIDLIRDTLGYHCMRIILRTGQPGSAPESALVSRYDIHDYMLKMDVSRERLVTSLTTAVRTYQQLAKTALMKRQLSNVVSAVSNSLSLREPEAFVRFYMQQLTDIYQLSPIIALWQPLAEDNALPIIMATDHAHQAWQGKTLSEIVDHPLGDYLREVIADQGKHIFSDVILLETKAWSLFVLINEDDYSRFVLTDSWQIFQSLMTICAKHALH